MKRHEQLDNCIYAGPIIELHRFEEKHKQLCNPIRRLMMSR